MAEEREALEARRKTFARFLQEQNPKLAALYAGALHLVDDEKIPGRAALIAHAARELRNVVPKLVVPGDVSGGPGAKRIEYHKELAPIAANWGIITALLQSSENDIERSDELAIPRRVVEKIDKLIIADQAVAPTLRQRIIAMCARVTSDASGWTGNEALAKQWQSYDFERIAHVSENDDEPWSDDDAIGLFLKFEEDALNIFDYAPERVRRIIEFAESATTKNLEEGLRAVVTLNDEALFYERLRNPDLLPALKKLGKLDFTENSPLYWPQTSYLANIVEAAPSGVADVLIGVQTDRPGTIRGLSSVALKLTDAELLRVARKAKWLTTPSVAFLEQYVALVKRAGEARDVGLAFSLAGRSLKIESIAPRVPFPGVERMDAVAKIGDDWLEFFLQRIVPVLSAFDAGRAIELLSDSLNEAVAIEHDDDVWRGYSGWSENLLSEQQPHHGTKRILTTAIRDASVKLAAENIDLAIERLNRPVNASHIYVRIGYVCILRANDFQRAKLLFSKAEAWVQNGPEHRALVERFFGDMTEQERSQISEVAFEAVSTYLKPLLAEREIGADRGTEIIRQYLLERFGTAAAAVPEPYASQLTQPEHMKAEPPRTLPTLADMQALSATKLAELLQSWQPTDAGTLDGAWSIGAALNTIFRTDAASWLSQRDAFNQIPLYYLGWALNALQTYRQNTRGADDERILLAVEDSLERLEEPLKKADAQMLGIAQHIAQSAGVLLENITMSANSQDTITRTVVAARRLAQIPTEEERLAHRTQLSAPGDAGGDARGLSALIIGQALSAAARNKFSIPTIETLYDELTKGDSLVTRAACGRYFDWFARIYPGRAVEWKVRLFQSGNENADKAAWNGYVFFLDLNLDTYKLLRDVYVLRVGQLAQVEEPDDNGMQSHIESIFKKRTIHHVWLLLANRFEEIGVDKSLAELMLKSASLAQIRELLSDIPQTLHDDKIVGGQNQKVNAEAIRLWDAVESRVTEGKLPQSILASASLWLKAPLPFEWRFSLADRVANLTDESERNDWDLVPAFIDLAQYDREHALRLLERLARTVTMTALTNIQMNAAPLLLQSVEGSDNEKHLAQSINSILMNNGRPNLLESAGLGT